MIEVTLNLTTEQIEQIARKMIEISATSEQTQNSKEVFLKVREVAEILKISEQTVRKYIKDGTLKRTNLNGAIRISNREIERYAQSV